MSRLAFSTPTASGKSAVAQYLALLGHPTRPILAADSMTIYRGMDVGTAKPEAADRAAVPSFGFDLVDPDRPFSVGDWLAAVRAAAPAIAACVTCMVWRILAAITSVGNACI